MEKIIKRLLIVVTIGSVLLGPLLMVTGYRNEGLWTDTILDTAPKSERAYRTCLAAAQNRGDELKCNAARDEDLNYLRIAKLSAKKNGSQGDFGALLILVAIFVWPSFFLGRWIFTGRLRGKAKAAT